MSRVTAVIVAVGIVAGLTATASVAISEEATLSSPRTGDRLLIQPTGVHWEGVGEVAETPGLVAAVEEPETVEDGYGRDHRAWPVRTAKIHEDGDTDDGSVAWTLRRDGPPIVVDRGRTEGREWHYHRPTGEADSVRLPERRRAYSTRDRSVATPDCALLAPWSGRTVSEGDELSLPSCGDGPSESLRHTVRSVHGLGDPASIETVVDGRVDEVRVHVEATWRTDTPYPVETVVELSWPGPNATPPDAVRDTLHRLPTPGLGAALDAAPLGVEDADGDGRIAFQTTLRLDRFERGTGPAVPRHDPTSWPDRRPEMAFADMGRYGPPADGPTFAFPLDDALEAIRRDPTLADYHDWADDHPDRRVAFAMHERVESTTNRFEGWGLDVVGRDGTAWRLLSLKTLEAGTSDAHVGPVPSLPAVQNDAWRLDDGVRDYPEDLDHPVPTRSAALSVWQRTVDATDRSPNWYLWRHEGDQVDYLVGWRNPDREMVDPDDPTRYRYRIDASLIEVQPSDGAVRTVTRTVSNGSVDTLEGATGDPSSWAGTADHRLAEPPPPVRPDRAVTWAAASIGVAVLAWLASKLAGSLGLYSRLDDDELLDNTSRRVLVRAIRDDPGATTAEVAATADIHRSTARYHLRRLAEAGLIARHRAHGQTRWFPGSGWTRSEMAERAALATGRTREVYDAIRDDPGTSLSGLADRIDVQPSLIHRIVERLRDVGLVEKRREGREVALRAAGSSGE